MFRDVLGRVNQVMADAADAVYLVIAGIPIDLKRLAADEATLLSAESDIGDS